MGRPKRIFVNNLVYHITTKTVPETPGFYPKPHNLNPQLKNALNANTKLAYESSKQKKPLNQQQLMEITKQYALKLNVNNCANQKALNHPISTHLKKLKEQRKKEKEKQKQKASEFDEQLNALSNEIQNSSLSKKKRKKLQKQIKRLKELRKKHAKIPNPQNTSQTYNDIKGMFQYIPRILILLVVAQALKKIMSMGFVLFHFVLMATHYHMLGMTTGKTKLDEIMRMFNWYIATEINKILGRSGRFFHSRYKANILGNDELGAIMLRYVYQNPKRTKLAIEPLDHDCTTFRVYLGKDEEFLVDISKECPIIKKLCKEGEDKGEFLRNLVEQPLTDEVLNVVRFAIKRHQVWMTSETYESLSRRVKRKLKEAYEKLNESLQKIDHFKPYFAPKSEAA